MNSNSHPTSPAPTRSKGWVWIPDKAKQKSIRAKHFSETDKELAMTLFATGSSPSEINRILKEDYNIELQRTSVYLWSRQPKWIKFIAKIRQKTMSELCDVAGSYKKVRLMRQERIFDQAMDKNLLRTAMEVTAEQRKEMEGDGNGLNVSFNQFNILSDDELEIRRRETMEKIKLMSEFKQSGGKDEPGDQTNTAEPKRIVAA